MTPLPATLHTHQLHPHAWLCFHFDRQKMSFNSHLSRGRSLIWLIVPQSFCEISCHKVGGSVHNLHSCQSSHVGLRSASGTATPHPQLFPQVQSFKRIAEDTRSYVNVSMLRVFLAIFLIMISRCKGTRNWDYVPTFRRFLIVNSRTRKDKKLTLDSVRHARQHTWTGQTYTWHNIYIFFY